MPRWIFLLLLLLSIPTGASAQSAAPLRVVVRDATSAAPVPGVTLTLDGPAAGATTTLTTDAAGVAELPTWPAPSVRIVRAADAQGQPLRLAANDPAGGLRLPLVAGQTQILPLLFEDDRLIVEPVALADESITGGAQAQAATAAPTAPALSSAPPATAPAAPTAQAEAGRALFGWLLALLVGVPVVVWGLRFAWRLRATRSQRGTR